MRVLMFFLVLGAAQAQDAAIRGIVKDSQTGEPLARVKVALLASTYETVTDDKGRFELNPIQAGGYTIQASTVGYRVAKKDFDLAERETKEFEVALSPDTFRQTDSVEVHADVFEPLRVESPSELTLQGNEVKNLASVLADDPLRAVQALPGVSSGDDFNATFSLRGASYERIGLYLDGVLMHTPFHTIHDQSAAGSLTVFNGDMIEDMALMSGAFPARYGDRTAGVLDVRLRDGSRKQISIRGTASASNAGLLAEGPIRGGRGSWMASLRKSYLQYIINRTAGDKDPMLAFGFWDGQTRASYDLGRTHTVNLTLVDGRSSLDRTKWRGRFGSNSIMLGGYNFTLAALGWRWTPRSQFLLSMRGAWTRETYWNANRDYYRLGAGHYGEWVWNTNATWIQTAAASLDGGFSVRRIKDSGYSNWYQFNPFAVRSLDAYGANGRIESGYVQQTVTLFAGRLRLTAGGRWDRYSLTGAAILLPRASAAIALWRSARLQFGWGEYAQFPSLQSLYSITGNRNLAPERALHSLASVEQRLGERSRVRAEFYQRLDRDLTFRPFADPRLFNGVIFNPPINTPAFNSMRGYSRGFEVFYQRRTANRFTGWISYARGYARVHDGLARRSFWADEDQRNTFNMYGGYRIRPTVNLSVRTVYGSGFPIPGFFRQQGSLYYLADKRNEVRLPSYNRTDLRINKAWVYDRFKLTLYAEGVNVFNHTNRRFDVFNGYNGKTGQAYPQFNTMFPILPSAGVVAEF